MEPATPTPTSQPPSQNPRPAPIQPQIQSYSQQNQFTDKSQKSPIHFKVVSILYLLISFLAFMSGSSSDLNAGGGFGYFILGFFGLLVAVGLFLRQELARKFAIILSVITIFAYSLSIFGMLAIQGRLSDLKNNYEAATVSLRERQLSSAQQEQLNQMDELIKQKEGELSSMLPLFYATAALNIILNTVFIIYLTRPTIRSIFLEGSNPSLGTN